MKAAQAFLESASQTNLPELIRTLSDVLYHGANSAVVRQQAGVQLKNFLYTNDESLRAQYEDRWLNIPEDVRVYTKQNVVGALGTESFRPSAAAQCVHMIAVVELPRGCWPGQYTNIEKKTVIIINFRIDHNFGWKCDQPGLHRDDEGEHPFRYWLHLPRRGAQVIVNIDNSQT